MKICIFGADGRTRVEVVKECLNQGYQVVSFIYNENSKKYISNSV